MGRLSTTHLSLASDAINRGSGGRTLGSTPAGTRRGQAKGERHEHHRRFRIVTMVGAAAVVPPSPPPPSPHERSTERRTGRVSWSGRTGTTPRARNPPARTGAHVRPRERNAARHQCTGHGLHAVRRSSRQGRCAAGTIHLRDCQAKGTSSRGSRTASADIDCARLCLGANSDRPFESGQPASLFAGCHFDAQGETSRKTLYLGATRCAAYDGQIWPGSDGTRDSRRAALLTPTSKPHAPAQHFQEHHDHIGTPRVRLPRRGSAGVVAALVLVLAGCGANAIDDADTGSSSPAPSTSSPTTPDSTTSSPSDEASSDPPTTEPSGTVARG